jgi:hypothetical protein
MPQKGVSLPTNYELGAIANFDSNTNGSQFYMC